ncbi:MAG TPA: class I adenylate-forming enzyme family protein [Acidimicrobiia bacterium]|jgi:acyl-CoA synthetase (AMP-forming)/AMP-acid ligase II|nr:class I adenylate-forming enzyme family protein [Acidimicrobiia bacterium]
MDGRRVTFPDYTPTAGAFLDHVVEAWGDRELVVLDERRCTYRDVEAASRQLAKGLLANGVCRGTHVGLLAPNGPEWVAGYFAVTRIGAVAIPLNTYSKPRELSWVMEHAGVEVLLTVDRHLGHDYLDRLEVIASGLAGQVAGQIHVESHPKLRSVWTWAATDRPWGGSVDDLLASAGAVTDEALADAEAAVGPDDPMVVVYSSGSASDPKGVVHSHGAVIRHPYNTLRFRDIGAGDVVYTPMPLFWVGGLVWALLTCMHAGATVVFEQQFEPGASLDLLERERVTHVIGWPHIAKALTEHPTFPARDLGSIRGGSLDELLPEERRVGDPNLRANTLGMTESLGPHSLEVIGSALPPGKDGSFGRSVPGVEHRIVDPVTRRSLPTGEVGEIWIRGYSLMIGILGRDHADVFEEGGWYATGDCGYLDDDGHLYFKGRLGNVIKSSGTNVTPREVELVIEAQPDVMHAFVAAVPHRDRGEDVAAVVVARPGVDIDPADLRARVKEDLSSYKVPRHIAVVAAASDLPWLDSGKIDLRGVQRLLIDRFGT